MKTLFNILKTIGVIVFLIIAYPILWVIDVYNSVKHPDEDGLITGRNRRSVWTITTKPFTVICT